MSDQNAETGTPEEVAEAEIMCTRCEALRASYEAKVEDLARETTRVSAALAACSRRGIKSPSYVVGEAGQGWDAAMEYVEQAIQTASQERVQSDREADRG